MEIVTVAATATRVVNPFVDDIKQLIEATNKYLADPKADKNMTPAGVFPVLNKDAEKSVFYIQQAAIEQGVTARIVSKQVDTPNKNGNAKRVPVKDVDDKGKETGTTTLIFKIAPKRAENGRKSRTASASE